MAAQQKPRQGAKNHFFLNTTEKTDIQSKGQTPETNSQATAEQWDNEGNNTAVMKTKQDSHTHDNTTSPRSDFIKINEVKPLRSPLSDLRDANTETSVQLPKWNSIKPNIEMLTVTIPRLIPK